jgi:hypothetical protein
MAREKMTLFDDSVDRSGDGPPKHSEPRYQYLNRSGRLDIGRIRVTLEQWYARYPEEHQRDLLGRFRSDDDAHHVAAFFELYLHELLIRLDCRVVLHPELSGGVSTRPDFLVERLDGERFYLEAALATDESTEEASKRRMINVVYDTLNRMESPNFFIGVEPVGSPTSSPPGREIRSFLERELAKLNPDDVAQLIEKGGYRAAPEWRFEAAGWRAKFFPIPKSPDARGKPGVRPLGMWFHGVHQITTWQAIRDSVLAKAGRYGELDLPYVVAVDVFAEHQDRIQVMEALFGQEQIVIRWSGGIPGKAEPARAPNGVWTSETGPRNTRVSAVLIGENVLPSRAAAPTLCLYHNPWAKRAYRGALTRLPQAVPVVDHMEWRDGLHTADALGLPKDWPG